MTEHEPTLAVLARDVFSLAQRAGMPDTYWATDSRIARACAVLGISPTEARESDWSFQPGSPGALASDDDFDEPVPAAETPAVTEAWTDGACRNNPGPGGWGWITPDGRQGSGAEPGTTNQRMEVLAAFEAIRSVPERPLLVVSDSRYVVDAFNKAWWKGWLKRGWKNSQGQPVANRDLWEPFIDLVIFGGVTAAEDPHRQPVPGQVAFRWVKGHAGYPLNEAADRLAVAARETLPTEPRRNRRRR